MRAVNAFPAWVASPSKITNWRSSGMPPRPSSARSRDWPAIDLMGYRQRPVIRIPGGAGYRHRLPLVTSVLLTVLMLLTSATPSPVPPASGVMVALPGHVYLHMLALPLGRLE